MARDAPTNGWKLEGFLRPPDWQRDARVGAQGRPTTPVAPGQLRRRPGAAVGTFRCAECLAAAVADDSLVGLWGGTTEAERLEMRRGRVA